MTEREQFKSAHKHLDLSETKDAWDRPIFAHSHVEAMWSGWQAALESRVLAKPVYQRREKHAWVDTSKLGYEHWPEDQRRIVFAHPTPSDKHDGNCRSCVNDKCVTGPECVTLGRDSAPIAVLGDEREKES
jgi:hypothetical protein